MPIRHPDSWQEMHYYQWFNYLDEPSHLTINSQTNKSNPSFQNSPEQEIINQKNKTLFIFQVWEGLDAFARCTVGDITKTVETLLQLSFILTHGLWLPVTNSGRFACESARLTDFNTENGALNRSNRAIFNVTSKNTLCSPIRISSRLRLLKGYHYVVLTIFTIQATINDDFANNGHPENRTLNFVNKLNNAKQYQAINTTLTKAIAFLTNHDSHFDASANLSLISQLQHEKCHNGITLGIDKTVGKEVTECISNVNSITDMGLGKIQINPGIEQRALVLLQTKVDEYKAAH